MYPPGEKVALPITDDELKYTEGLVRSLTVLPPTVQKNILSMIAEVKRYRFREAAPARKTRVIKHLKDEQHD